NRDDGLREAAGFFAAVSAVREALHGVPTAEALHASPAAEVRGVETR
ncbi:MAG: hypothetical protein H7279_07345, partial [Microbacteriaceae bacterium]|nr:hypothetical protein [Microbacteriaceae bacterium]